MEFEFAAIPAIAVICYLFAEGIKAIGLNVKWIPIFCGTFGGILGIVAMYVMPSFVTSDPLTAIAIGIVSGGGATWVNQIGKQLGR